MPSYRVTLRLGRFIAPIAPQDVQPRIREACAEVATVEACDIALERGMPVVVTRFTGLSDAEAVSVGVHTRDSAANFCVVEHAAVTKRVRNRWLPIS
ncbi:Hypotetical protein [Gulosibacter molinativorax]|nr:Hypotetical protein [Gulosibacter molinativorax]